MLPEEDNLCVSDMRCIYFLKTANEGLVCIDFGTFAVPFCIDKIKYVITEDYYLECI